MFLLSEAMESGASTIVPLSFTDSACRFTLESFPKPFRVHVPAIFDYCMFLTYTCDSVWECIWGLHFVSVICSVISPPCPLPQIALGYQKLFTLGHKMPGETREFIFPTGWPIANYLCSSKWENLLTLKPVTSSEHNYQLSWADSGNSSLTDCLLCLPGFLTPRRHSPEAHINLSSSQAASF